MKIAQGMMMIGKTVEEEKTDEAVAAVVVVAEAEVVVVALAMEIDAVEEIEAVVEVEAEIERGQEQEQVGGVMMGQKLVQLLLPLPLLLLFSYRRLEKLCL